MRCDCLTGEPALMCRSASLVSLALTLTVLAASTACKEESGVKVTSFKFIGVKAVTDGQLRSVLATIPSSSLPWGEKHYFSREQFNADLKRIEAFYKDRGFPDARVSSYDVQPNKDQTAVKITVTVSEGNPIVVERIVFQGLEPLPEQHRHSLEADLPLKQGQPLDRALLQASREATRRRAQTFTWDRCVAEYVELYASALPAELGTPAADSDRPLTTFNAK